MKELVIRHWTSTNGSGMHHVAEACAKAERALGLDSLLVDVANQDAWVGAEWADVHVLHTSIPDVVRKKSVKPFKYVFVAHGTPEVVMSCSVEQFARPGYAPGDGWMLLRHQLREADATITFWPRHSAIYRSLISKAARHTVHDVLMGVDREFWAAGEDRGRYDGAPSVWMGENQYPIKWGLDVLFAWPWVCEQVPDARLHYHHIPTNLHRFFIDLANTNGAAYRGHLSSAQWQHEDLRNIWKSCDFLMSPVRYGDHNNLCMQAAATGLKVISYTGNLYADYWITEGDQRGMAQELVRIFKGEVQPRADKLPVPDIRDTSAAMIKIYESVIA